MGFFDDLAKERAAKAAAAHQPPPNYRQMSRQLAGQPVTVLLQSSEPVRGDLVDISRSSVWLVVGGRDEMIPLGEVAGIQPPPTAA